MKKRSRQSYETCFDGWLIEPQRHTTGKSARLSYLACADEGSFAMTIERARHYLYQYASRNGPPTPELPSSVSSPGSDAALPSPYDRVLPVCIEAVPIQEKIVGWTCSKVISQVLAATESERCMLSGLVHRPVDFSFVGGTDEATTTTHHTVSSNTLTDDPEVDANSPHFQGFVMSANDIDVEDVDENGLTETQTLHCSDLSLTAESIEGMRIDEERMLRE